MRGIIPMGADSYTIKSMAGMGRVSVEKYGEIDWESASDTLYYDLDRLTPIEGGYEGTVDVETPDDDIAPGAQMVVVRFDDTPLTTRISAPGPYEIVDHLMSVCINAEGLVQLVTATI